MSSFRSALSAVGWWLRAVGFDLLVALVFGGLIVAIYAALFYLTGW